MARRPRTGRSARLLVIREWYQGERPAETRFSGAGWLRRRQGRPRLATVFGVHRIGEFVVHPDGRASTKEDCVVTENIGRPPLPYGSHPGDLVATVPGGVTQVPVGKAVMGGKASWACSSGRRPAPTTATRH